MKKALLALAFLCAPALAHADLIATSGKNELRLQPGKCDDAAILAPIHPDHHDRFKRAQAWVNEKLHLACWVDTGEGAYFVIFDDGQMVAYSVTVFIEKLGV